MHWIIVNVAARAEWHHVTAVRQILAETPSTPLLLLAGFCIGVWMIGIFAIGEGR